MKSFFIVIALLLSIVASAQVNSSGRQPVRDGKSPGVRSMGKQPEFPGGKEALNDFIEKHIQYPKLELDSQIDGTVSVGVMIETDGTISMASVPGRNRISRGLDSEAIRVVKLLPRFEPGLDDGDQPTRVLMYIPVVFRLPGGIAGRQKSSAGAVKQLPAYFKIDEEPQFPGGEEALLKFLKENIRYPKKEGRNGIEGKVLMRFLVNEDGHVSDVIVVKSISPGLDKEALRVVSLLPDFKPGMYQGKPIKFYYNLPISFRSRNNLSASPGQGWSRNLIHS